MKWARTAQGCSSSMPVVEGDTLEARLSHGPLPISDAVSIALQAADALAVAHSAGVLHRDMKPGNLIVNARGQVRVMDFGLAKLAAIPILTGWRRRREP